MKKKFTIEFMGMPKAGKTTQMEILESNLKEKGYTVRCIYEGARVSPLDKKDYFLFNSWSFNNTTNKILEAKLYDTDYILIDRGVYDHTAFSKALRKSNRITSKEADDSISYFRHFYDIEDLVFLFAVPPEVSLRREFKHKNTGFGRVLNPDFLKTLFDAYLDVENEIEKDHLVIDGTKKLKENSREMMEKINSQEKKVEKI